MGTFKVVQLCNVIPATGFLPVPIPQKIHQCKSDKKTPTYKLRPTTVAKPLKKKTPCRLCNKKTTCRSLQMLPKPKQTSWAASQNLQLQALCLWVICSFQLMTHRIHVCYTYIPTFTIGSYYGWYVNLPDMAMRSPFEGCQTDLHQASTATTASRPSLGRGGEWFCWFFNSTIGNMAYDCVNQYFKQLYITQIKYITYAKYIVLKTILETKTWIIICYFRLLPSKWPFDHITDAHLKNATGVNLVDIFQTIQQPWHPPNKCGEALSA